jgi:hypothetical protein
MLLPPNWASLCEVATCAAAGNAVKSSAEISMSFFICAALLNGECCPDAGKEEYYRPAHAANPMRVHVAPAETNCNDPRTSRAEWGAEVACGRERSE